jgi:hypothetical protein
MWNTFTTTYNRGLEALDSFLGITRATKFEEDMEKAVVYEEWKQAAEKIDNVRGYSETKKGKDPELYDHLQIEMRTEVLQSTFFKPFIFKH